MLCWFRRFRLRKAVEPFCFNRGRIVYVAVIKVAVGIESSKCNTARLAKLAEAAGAALYEDMKFFAPNAEIVEKNIRQLSMLKFFQKCDKEASLDRL